MSQRVQRQARDLRDAAWEREKNARERAARNRERGEQLLARRHENAADRKPPPLRPPSRLGLPMSRSRASRLAKPRRLPTADAARPVADARPIHTRTRGAVGVRREPTARHHVIGATRCHEVSAMRVLVLGRRRSDFSFRSFDARSRSNSDVAAWATNQK
jgi:hypothetical protein